MRHLNRFRFYHAVSRNGEWYFDSKADTQEILFRRIGKNESSAIEVCEEFAITKKNQDARPANYDPITQFAQSPIYAGAADAGGIDSPPFHGYYFRLVKGNSAAGATGYVSGSHKKGGVVLVA